MHRKSMEVAQHYNNNDSGSEPESSSDLTENLSSSTKKSMHQQFLDYQQNSSIGGSGNSLTGNGGSGPGGNGSGMPEFAAAAAAAAAAMAAANSEDFRSHSIAALRARAQQHQASLTSLNQFSKGDNRNSPNSSHLIHDWTCPSPPPNSSTPNLPLPPGMPLGPGK